MSNLEQKQWSIYRQCFWISLNSNSFHIHIKCDPVQRCAVVSWACAPAQNVRHILPIKAIWTVVQDFILPNCPINSCESPISNNFKSQEFWTRVIFTCGFHLLCVKKNLQTFLFSKPCVDGAKLYKANRVVPKYIDGLDRLIIWHPLKPVLFKRLQSKAGLTKILIIFGENISRVETWVY